MPTYHEMLAPVLEFPADDGPRLIMADWLEDHDEPERAEFIRAQCELTRFGPRSAAVLYHKQQEERRLKCETIGCDYCRLRRRERELLNAHMGAWSAALPLALVFAVIKTHCWRRGFVASLVCSWEDWLAHGDAIRQAQPVEAVELTTWPQLDWADASPEGRGRTLYAFAGDRTARRFRRVDRLPTSGDPFSRSGLQELLSWTWPGVRFALPRGEDMTGLNRLLRQIRDQAATS